MKIKGKKVPNQIGGILSKKPWKGYARGGSLPEDELYEPSHGGTVPRALQNMMPQAPDSWRRPPQRRADGGNVKPLPIAGNEWQNLANQANELRRRLEGDRLPQGPRPVPTKADGGEVDPLTLGLANPSFDERWLDRAGHAHLGQKPDMLKSLFRAGNASANKPPERDYSNLGLFGELRGTAPEDTPTAIQTKNPMMAITEGDIERGMNVGMGAGPGIMVGPFGAFMLRNAARDAGKAAAPHPVYAAETEQVASKLRPEFRDAYRGWEQDARDAMAQYEIAARRRQNNPYDRDIFAQSGWTRGDEGGVPQKEIPDIGAKLVPVPGLKNKFALEHPAGDLHKIYDIPPIEFDPKIPKGDGYMELETGRIVLGGKPSKTSLKDAVSPALHEVQHVIQKKEGFEGGANPAGSFTRPEFPQEYFPKEGLAEDAMGPITMLDQLFGIEARAPHRVNIPSWQADQAAKQEARGRDPASGKRGVDRAAFNVYERKIGETQSRNVQDRRAKSFKYKLHPEDTESIPRGLQWGNKDMAPRPRESLNIPELIDERDLRAISRAMVEGRPFKTVNLREGASRYKEAEEFILNLIKRGAKPKADGGEVESNAPWFTKAQARGSGMLKSTIPGRTDKIPLKVGGGSYVLPADIPSALGQGNTMAGSTILDKMFQRGPYGMNLPRARAGQSTKMSRMSSLTKTRSRLGFAEGGPAPEVPIIAAGGEYILSPDQVLHVGGGDMKRGHDILDQFVLSVRKEHINTLKGLKPPKKD